MIRSDRLYPALVFRYLPFSSVGLRIMQGESSFESLVGITSFVNSQQGFKGILKQRFSDFIVREIDEMGCVSQLKSVIVPKSIADIEEKYFKLSNAGIEDIPLVIKSIEAAGVTYLLPIDEIANFFEMCINKQPDCLASINLAVCTDKMQRSIVHQSIKQKFAVNI